MPVESCYSGWVFDRKHVGAAASLRRGGLCSRPGGRSYQVDRIESLSEADLTPYIEAWDADREDPDIDLEHGPFTVAMTIEGHLESAFAPEAEEGDE